MRFVHLNGRLVPEEDARVSPFDRGLLLGDAVFETLRAYAGAPFALDEHLARLRESCRTARLPWPEEVGSAVREVLHANALGEASVRITVTRGPGKPGASPRGAGPPTVLVTALPVEPRPEVWERGLALMTARRRRPSADSLEPSMKTTNYMVNVLAKIEAEEAGADEALFVDGEGFVVEATTANVFAILGDRLLTPPLSSGCLPGVTRAHVLQLAPEVGLRPDERPLPRAALHEADEVFLTASVTEVAPVVALDGVRVGEGQPGPRAAAVHRAYRAHAQQAQRK